MLFKLKYGILKIKVTKRLIQRCHITHLETELVCTSFHSISVQPRVCAEKYLNKIRSQTLNWNVFSNGRHFTSLCVGIFKGSPDPNNFIRHTRTLKLNHELLDPLKIDCNWGCVFPIVIWPAWDSIESSAIPTTLLTGLVPPNYGLQDVYDIERVYFRVT